MSDFFYHIAARSFDQFHEIEPVQPRLRSLFEPAPQSPRDLDALFIDADPGNVVENAAPEDLRTAESPTSEPVRDNSGDRIASHRITPQPTENGNNTTYTPPQAVEGKNARDGHEAPDRDVPSRPRTEPRADNPNPPKVKQSVGQTRIDSTPHKAHHPDVIREKAAQGSGQPQPRTSAGPIVVEKVRVREMPSGNWVPKNQEPEIIPRAVRYAGPGIEPIDAVAARKDVPRQEPTVNVTIGRIEVRASVPPPTPPQKPVKQPPVMGLEEYLRRRSKGRDR